MQHGIVWFVFIYYMVNKTLFLRTNYLIRLQDLKNTINYLSELKNLTKSNILFDQISFFFFTWKS